MKIIKARYDLVFFFFFPFLIMTTLLYLGLFQWFTLAANVNWLFDLTLLLLLFLPIGKQAIGPVARHKRRWKWFLELLLSQLIINLIIWSFNKLLVTSTSNDFQGINVIQLSFQSGLFPWGFMMLFGLTLGYFTYHQGRMALLSSAYKPLFNNTHMDSIGIAVDSYMRFIPTCIVVFSLSTLALTTIIILQHYISLPLSFGMRFDVIAISSILFLLTSHKYWLHYLHKLMFQGRSTAVICLGFVLILSMIYLILSWLINYFLQLNPTLDLSFTPINPMYQIMNAKILIVFWWFGLAAINGAYIAYISRNRTIREVIIYSLLANFCGWGLIKGIQETNHFIQLNIIPLLLLLICNVWIMIIILGKKHFTYFLRATLPTEEPIKFRSSFRFLKIIPLVTVAFLSAYFATNVSIWAYLALLGFLPPVIIIFISYIGFFVAVVSSQAQCHPEPGVIPSEARDLINSRIK